MIYDMKKITKDIRRKLAQNNNNSPKMVSGPPQARVVFLLQKSSSSQNGSRSLKQTVRSLNQMVVQDLQIDI